MPALVNSRVGSFAGTSEDEWTRRCPFSQKTSGTAHESGCRNGVAYTQVYNSWPRGCPDILPRVPYNDLQLKHLHCFLTAIPATMTLLFIMRPCPKSIALLFVLCTSITNIARAQEIKNIPQFTATLDDAPPASSPPGFFRRLANYYHNDWFPPPAPSGAQAAPAPQKRGLPSPLDSPPLPSSDWGYGGSPGHRRS